MKKFSLIALFAMFSMMMASCDKKENVTPQYAIAFDLQGKGTAIDTIYVEDGSLIVAPEEPTDEFYTFEGWYKDAKTTTPWNFETDFVTGNMTLYAKWIFNGFSVTFNTNDLAFVPKMVVDSGSYVVEPQTPTNNFHTFAGWYKDAETTIPWDFNTDVVTQNTTIYAKWEKKKHCCVVIFNSQLSGVSVPRDTVDYTATVTKPADPEDEDNYFDGWYKDRACTTKWDFETDSLTQKTTTLYAKWKPKYKYYGAELYSIKSFKYGRFEARMKMAYAPGCISSMFLYYNESDKTSSPLWNEIDIEVIGKDSQRFQSNIITGKKGAQITSEQMLSPGFVLDSDYHVYTIEWTPEYVAWLVDGVELRKTELGAGKEQVEDLIKEQSLRFNLWANSTTSWVGKMTHVNIPITQYIDYVTVYDYNTETKEFSELWKDDFDSFNSTRWKKGNWQMDLVMENPNNVVIEDGNLLLKLTKEAISY